MLGRAYTDSLQQLKTGAPPVQNIYIYTKIKINGIDQLHIVSRVCTVKNKLN